MTNFTKSKTQYKSGVEYHRRKGGTYHNSLGYKMIRMPNHPRSGSNGYVREHIVIMENYLKRSLKPGEIIHHINGIRDDNRIENLELFDSHSKHLSIHMKKDMSNRICLKCNSNNTFKTKTNYQMWYKYKDGFICITCFNNSPERKEYLKNYYKQRNKGNIAVLY